MLYIFHIHSFSLQQSSTENTLFDDGQPCCKKQPIDGGRNLPITFGVQRNRNHPPHVCINTSNAPRTLVDNLCPLFGERLLHTGKCAGWQAPVPHTRAIQAISRMRGGAQSQLMLCDDSNLWVVKFKNNPQHLTILANELIATRMADAIGLSVPMSEIVEVGEWLIEASPQLSVYRGRNGREICSSGLQFGSKFVGGLMPGQVIDCLPDEKLVKLHNIAEFAGILAFDKWTGNSDGRQAVYRRRTRAQDYNAIFIDQGFCFNAGEWTFSDAPLKGVFARNIVYSAVTGWDSFEPWLTRIEQFSPEMLWEIVKTVPLEWYESDSSRIHVLIETLLRRRVRVRDLINQFRRSDRTPFPRWNDTYGGLPSPLHGLTPDEIQPHFTSTRPLYPVVHQP